MISVSGTFSVKRLPIPFRRLDLDLAIERGEICFHNVKTNAATREFRLARRRGEARAEQQFEKIALGQTLRVVGVVKATIDRRLANTLVIDSASIVFDFNVDVIAAMVSADCDRSMIWLPCLVTIFVTFDSVCDGIANQVQERIGNLLNDVVVEFGLCARQREVNLFIRGLRCVAYSS